MQNKVLQFSCEPCSTALRVILSSHLSVSSSTNKADQKSSISFVVAAEKVLKFFLLTAIDELFL